MFFWIVGGFLAVLFAIAVIVLSASSGRMPRKKTSAKTSAPLNGTATPTTNRIRYAPTVEPSATSTESEITSIPHHPIQTPAFDPELLMTRLDDELPSALGTEFFIGRNEALKTLHDTLSKDGSTVVVAIAGIGGVGKTQLAIEYAHRFGGNYQGGIAWLRGDREHLVGEMARLSERLGLRRESNETDDSLIRRATELLIQKTARTLIVIDGAQDWRRLSGWMTRLRNAPQHDVLLTTRNPSLAPTYEVQTIRLTTLSEEDGLELLFRYAESPERPRPEPDSVEYESAQALVRRMGRLPLALRLAGGSLNLRPMTTFAAYDARYVEHGVDMIDRDARMLLNAETTIESTFEPTWQRLNDQPDLSETRRLVATLAFFGDAPVSTALVSKASGLAQSFPSPFDEAFLRGQQIGVLEALTAERARCNPLIQHLVRKWVSEDEAREIAAKVATALTATIPASDDDLLTQLRSINEERPHLDRALRNIRAFGMEGDSVEFLLRMGRYHRFTGELESAKTLIMRALTHYEDVHGNGHVKITPIIDQYGLALYEMGDLEGAKDQFERTLRITVNQLGQEHPDIPLRVNHLARVYQDQGDWDTARSLYEKTIRLAERVLGAHHPTVAKLCDNLGVVHRQMGSFQAARDATQRALDIDERAFGRDHPNVAIRSANFGLVCQQMSDMRNARLLYERALQINRATFGEDHPRTQGVQRRLDIVVGAARQL
ncbi:MAG: tetratricopeptide repeat protein [Candidatus Poribacteria bacterium]|nr:tetratricopeptide repeat protein [Candidatus Poribacteria bacterium]